MLCTILLILSLFPYCMPTAAKGRNSKMKRARMDLFWHDDFNFTDFLVLPGLKGIGAPLSPVSAPFGAMAVFNDRLTQGPARHSPQLGTIQGIAIISAFDGYSSFSASTLTLKTSKYAGTLTFVGPFANNDESKLSVVGGTDDFMFVQGLILMKPFVVSILNATYSLNLNLFWPPHASSSSAYTP
eukprot:Gb_30774 [translate_table: standard]